MSSQISNGLEKTRPKIGVALSGASGRAIAHIGILEVLRENQIPVDYMVGCSSGALIAVSYATGTMEQLKDLFYKLNLRSLLKLWSAKNSKGGLFHLHNADDEIKKFTKGMNFEDVYPRLGFTATDLESGELVTLSMGDMTKAFKASVAVPGLFEPVVWGNKILVDGGLANIVPTIPTKEMGADIVIGVNLAADKFIYENKLPIWRGYRFITRFLGLQYIREKILTKFSSRIFFQFDSQSDLLEETDIKIPGVLTVLTKALDHAMVISKQWQESDMACDLMLEPRVKRYGKINFKSLEKIYLEGRKTAKQALPQIKKLIESYGE